MWGQWRLFLFQINCDLFLLHQIITKHRCLMSFVVQFSVPHQALWLCCAPAPVCPRWRSVSRAQLPLAPGLFWAPLGFDSPAAPLNCLPWWTLRAGKMAEQRSEASRCALWPYCYDCWRQGEMHGCSCKRRQIATWVLTCYPVMIRIYFVVKTWKHDIIVTKTQTDQSKTIITKVLFVKTG